jgi:hypothetical protein
MDAPECNGDLREVRPLEGTAPESEVPKALDELSAHGVLERRHLDDDNSKDVYGITMAGKVWLLKSK